MNFEALREQARNWRANQEAGCEHSIGYVVIFNGQVAGWKRYLDNPQGWEPGCLAVSPEGDLYLAVGGNSYEGALAWKPLQESKAQVDADGMKTAVLMPGQPLTVVRGFGLLLGETFQKLNSKREVFNVAKQSLGINVGELCMEVFNCARKAVRKIFMRRGAGKCFAQFCVIAVQLFQIRRDRFFSISSHLKTPGGA